MLSGSTIKKEVGSVAQAFRKDDRLDLQLKDHGKTSIFLQDLFTEMTSTDKAPRWQPLLSLPMFRLLAQDCHAHPKATTGHLFVGAFFFAMRSCEYLQLVNGETRKTKLLHVRDFEFLHNHAVLTFAQWHKATAVRITFCFTKTGLNDQSRTQEATDDDILCPIKAWVAVCLSILKHKDGTPDTTINHLIAEYDDLIPTTTTNMIKLI